MGKTKIWVGKNGSKEGCGYDMTIGCVYFKSLAVFASG